MGGSFDGISLSMRGVLASQTALNITNQNITNTSTEGYVRRVATFRAIGINDTKGVEADAERMRDSYLDTKVWNEMSVSSEWATKETYYSEIMDIIDEPSDISLNTVTSEFFSAFEELAKDPSKITNRNTVLQKATQFTDFLNTMATSLENYQRTLNEQVKVEVADINKITREIADLNKQIYNTEITGGDASYQRDELELRIKELSEYGNVEITKNSYGTLINGSKDERMTVMFGGTVIVDHIIARELECTQRDTKANSEDIAGLYEVKTKEGTLLNLSSGKLKATLEVRDGNGSGQGSWVKGVPYYMGELNKFAQTFAKVFNEGITDYNSDGIITQDEKVNGYADGYVYSQADETKPAGIRFFTPEGISTADFIGANTELDDINALYGNVTAANLTLSSDVVNNIANVFSSFKGMANKNDTESVSELIGFRENSKIFGTGDIDSFIEGLVTNIGLDANMASDINTSHQALLEELENRRSAYSDVSIDEELTNIVRYQQLYNASAKVLSTFGELLDTLMNAI